MPRKPCYSALTFAGLLLSFKKLLPRRGFFSHSKWLLFIMLGLVGIIKVIVGSFLCFGALKKLKSERNCRQLPGNCHTFLETAGNYLAVSRDHLAVSSMVSNEWKHFRNWKQVSSLL